MVGAIRSAVVAGRFYPQDPAVLRAEIESYLAPPQDARPALGCVVPHAGVKYSGHVAGAVFARVELPRPCLILCPNHTGKGHPLSIVSQGSWETPLGQAPIDADFAASLKQAFPLLTEDVEAHRAEHAIEVELPFLQSRRSDFQFVPIALGTGQFEILEALGQAIASILQARSEPVLIIASSDMNHYESDVVTRTKDHQAIERMLALDARGLLDVVLREQISMCGFGPVVTMLSAVSRLGAVTAELVKYATSGDVSGDRNMVVGYAGMIMR